jgi:Spy/CpxP family protein refolding chaperone
MKVKFSFLLPGAIATLLITGSPLFNLAPVTAKEATPTMQPQKPGGMATKLNLSKDQEAKIKTIRQTVWKQIDGVLTQEQRDKYKLARKTMKPRQALQSLNLTKEQKVKIKGFLESGKKQISNVLTTEQREMLQKNRGQGQPDV